MASALVPEWSEVDPPVLVSALQHWGYCPRQCGLIHLEHVWDENVYTLRGTAAHERADTAMTRAERGKRIERALPIWSERLGLQGRADVVEFASDGTPYPIETKQGGKAVDLQLCAQALCLEGMFGRDVPEGAVYLVKERRRIAVAFDAALRTETLVAIEAVRAMLRAGVLPQAVHDRRCARCSLLDACVPQARTAALDRRAKDPYTPHPEVDLPT